MAKWAIIYSSVTGNTQRIAEAMAGELGAGADLFRVQDAPAALSAYEVVLLGYWLRRGAPDPLMLGFLPQVREATVGFFQTHGTEVGSEHAVTAFARAGYLLGEGCEILGTFSCQGKINPALIERRLQAGPDDPHGGARSIERWQKAAGHPDAADEEAARAFVRAMRRKLALRQKYLAARAARAPKPAMASGAPAGD